MVVSKREKMAMCFKTPSWIGQYLRMRILRWFITSNTLILLIITGVTIRYHHHHQKTKGRRTLVVQNYM